MTVVVLPPMSAAQEQAWAALLDIAERLPSGWCLVGGQMVHLHCVERGVVPQRPTDDADAALDVRSRPAMLAVFTGVLVDLGFTSAGQSLEGHQHRWVRDSAQIDVLIPRHVGARAAARRGVTGGTTLESPGTQQALDRTETVTVRLGERVGQVLRPDLLGALVGKAAAHTVTQDRHRQRHLLDFVVLCALIRPADRVGVRATRRDRQYLDRMLEVLDADGAAWASIGNGRAGVARLRLALSGD